MPHVQVLGGGGEKSMRLVSFLCIYVRGLGRIFQPGQRRTHSGHILPTYIVELDTACQKTVKSENRVLGLLVRYLVELRL